MRAQTLYGIQIPGFATASASTNTASSVKLGEISAGVNHPLYGRVVGVSLYNAQDCWVTINVPATVGGGIFVKGGAAAIAVAAYPGDVINVIRDSVDGSLKIKPLTEDA